MAKFYVSFVFPGGETYGMVIEEKAYNLLAGRITESHDGWFGVKGNMVNLRNVLRVTIQEVDEKDEKKQPGFDEVMKWL